MTYNMNPGNTEARGLIVVEGNLSPETLMRMPISYRPYLEALYRFRRRLREGYPVPEEAAVSIIGNNTLLERVFSLREQDKVPLRKVHDPGKSAHIAYTNDVVIACLTQLGRYPRREDRLYTVQVGLLRDVGFTAQYAPTSHRPLHTRLVPERLDSYGDVPIEIRKQLAALFQAYQSLSRYPQRRG